MLDSITLMLLTVVLQSAHSSPTFKTGLTLFRATQFRHDVARLVARCNTEARLEFDRCIFRPFKFQFLKLLKLCSRVHNTANFIFSRVCTTRF